MSRDPAAEWQQAKLSAPFAAHCAMADALRQSPGNSFELQPFAPMLVEGAWWIAAVAVDDVLLIGRKGEMRVLGDEYGAGFVGPAAEPAQPLRVYTNGVLLAREWAAARAAWLASAKAACVDPDAMAGITAAHMPGVAMVGDIAAIRQFDALQGASAVVIDNPRMRHVLADAMLKAARLPTVDVMQPRLKRVA